MILLRRATIFFFYRDERAYKGLYCSIEGDWFPVGLIFDVKLTCTGELSHQKIGAE
jgi:hypothetical protein